MAWSFEYEQEKLTAGNTVDQIYKFDHPRVVRAEWQPLNARSRPWYRTVQRYFQFVAPADELTDAEAEEILRLVEAAGPLQVPGAVEILIRRKEDRFEMTSHWIFLGPGAEFTEFSSRPWNEAYQRLVELEEGA
jgi:hypothetical protein